VVLPVEQNWYTAATFSLFQSMALGKAVIVSKTDAIAGGYDLAFGEELIGVPPGDPVMLRLWIKALLADPRRVQAMGERAARRIEETYPIEAFAARIVEIFREVV
jgi:glycosyltransferase involved in cell wall biosynthesis